MKNVTKITGLFVKITLTAAACLLMQTCDSWMNSDDFYSNIDNQVKVANAEHVSVTLQPALSKMGSTYFNGANYSGVTEQKYDVAFTVGFSAGDNYGFNHWAAFDTTQFTDSSTGTLDTYTNLSTIMYASSNSDPSYDTSLELGSDYVVFGSPNSTVTTVTLKTTSSSIIIIPVCAERPAILSSMPSSGSSGVVINAAIQIVFTKPIASEYLISGTNAGNTNYITVNYKGGSEEKPTYTDISSYFTAAQSASMQTLVLTLKNYTTNPLPKNKTIVVKISSEITDTDGYALGDDDSISFTVGTDSDTEAPVLGTLTGGFTDAKTFNKSYETTAVDSYKSFEAAYMDTAYRCNNYVNVYAFATDATKSGETGIEGNVYQLSYTVTSILATTATTTTTSGSYSYVSGGVEVDSSSRLSGKSFTDIMGTTTGGMVFSIDLSKLPDGIIRVDVWPVDNSGLKGTADSFFVIKDTTAPTWTYTSSQTSIDQSAYILLSNANSAWVNATTIKDITLTNSDTFKDSGSVDYHDYVSPSDSISWACRASSDTTWSIAYDSTLWKTATANSTYNLTDATAVDGSAVTIQAILMDDVGNISSVQTLSNTVNYDATKPAVTSTTFTADSGTGAASCTDTALLDDRTLVIPYTENASGVKTITITESSEKGSTVSSTPFAGGTGNAFAVYSDATLTTPIAGTASGTTYTFVSAVRTGTLYLRNLTVDSEEDTYTLTVTLTDDAGNSSDTSTAKIAIDNTAPVMTSYTASSNASGFAGNKDARSYPWSTSLTGNTLTLYVTETGAGLQTIRLSNTNVPTATTYDKGGFALTSSSTVSVAGTALVKYSAYTIATATNTITFLNSSTPAVQGTEEKIEITNVTAFVISGRTGAVFDSTPVVLTVFSGSTKKNTPETVYLCVNHEKPYNNTTLVISDISTGTGADIQAGTGYTNSLTVNLTLKPYEMTTNSTYYVSGIRSITLTNGVFTTSTVVTLTNIYDSAIKESCANELTNGSITENYLKTLAENETAPVSRTVTGYYLSNDLKTLYFYSPVMVNVTDMTVTNVTITNSSGTYPDGTYSMTAALADFAGNTSTANTSYYANDTGSIYYDTTKPYLNGDAGLFVAKKDNLTGYSPATNVYPHVNGTSAMGVILDSTTNGDGKAIRYFYTSGKKDSTYGVVLGIPAE